MLYAPLGLFTYNTLEDKRETVSFSLAPARPPRTCKTPTKIQKAKRSVQSSYCYCLKAKLVLSRKTPGWKRIFVECVYFKSDHIVLHSQNSIFVFVFACFFAFLFSFQFLNTRVTAKLQRETVPTERRVIDLWKGQKNAPLWAKRVTVVHPRNLLRTKKHLKSNENVLILYKLNTSLYCLYFLGLSTYADRKVFLDFFAAISSDFHCTVP